MRKFIIIFLLIGGFLNAQERKVSGVIKDSETKEAIPFAALTFIDSKSKNITGSFSNENGEYFLGNNEIEVEFSHLNYETLKINLKKDEKEILLKPKVYVLDELIMSEISGRDYLKSLIKDAQLRAVKNSKLSGYAREIVKINNQYTKFADAKIDYFTKKGNGKSIVNILQSRAFEAKLVDSTSSLVNGMNTFIDVRNVVKSAYNFSAIEDLLKSKEYTYNRYLKRDETGFEFEYIQIIPNLDSKKVLYEGFIIINNKLNKILEYKFEMSEKHKKNSKLKNALIAKIMLKDNSVWCKFKFVNNNYELVYYKNSFDFFIKMGNKVNDNISSTFDLFVQEYQYNVALPEVGYDKKSVFEAGTNFTNKFWNTSNSYPLKESEQQFINSIKNN